MECAPGQHTMYPAEREVTDRPPVAFKVRRPALQMADVNRMPPERPRPSEKPCVTSMEITTSPPEAVVRKGRRTGVVLSATVAKHSDDMENLAEFWESECQGPCVLTHFSQPTQRTQAAGVSCANASDLGEKSHSATSSSSSSSSSSAQGSSTASSTPGRHREDAKADRRAGGRRQDRIRRHKSAKGSMKHASAAELRPSDGSPAAHPAPGRDATQALRATWEWEDEDVSADELQPDSAAVESTRARCPKNDDAHSSDMELCSLSFESDEQVRASVRTS